MQKGSALIFLLVGVFILTITGGAFYLGRSTSPKPSPTPVATSQTPQPTPSPSSSDASPVPTGTGETANWKTYTNTKHGFSFKHPNYDDSCCGIAGPVDGKSVELVTLADPSTGKPHTDAPFNGLAIFVDSNVSKLSFNDYISNQKQSWLQWEKTTIEPKSTLQKNELSILVDGIQGVVLIGYAGWTGIIYVPFPDNKKILVIVPSQVTKEFSKTFDQILSTFKFL